ncbi:MAG: threonylcarbamoyl-AMP synthase [Clostridia bacterium]|nr:threonylcarbamoyl-AMP synthase [Clostridia bacterium]
MKTQVFTINDPSEAAEQLKAAGQIIRNGGLVVFPTETVYGLGGDGTNPDAAAGIYAAKGRPSDNPLIIHIADPEDADAYAYTCPLYFALAKAFMPGPLTVIMPKRDRVPFSVTGGLDSVAVRCPSHPVANALIRAAGTCIAAPSANTSGKPSPTEASHVLQDLNGKVDVIIDGGECEIGLESTIVKILQDDQGQPYLLLLRPGAITHDALCCVCPRVDIAPAVAERLAENERPLSPGMKYRHYAPTAPLVLLDGDAADVLAFLRAEQAAKKCCVLCFDEEADALAGGQLIPVGARDDLATQAKRLFAALREADATDAEIIYAHLPPKDGLGLALYNRMIRAAAHTVLKI